MLAAPIFGYYADRYNRKILISIGLFIWLCAVFLSATSQVDFLKIFTKLN